MRGGVAAKGGTGLAPSVLVERTARDRVCRWEGAGFLAFRMARGLSSGRCQRGQLRVREGGKYFWYAVARWWIWSWEACQVGESAAKQLKKR